MKAACIIKHITVVAALGLAFSAHAQLLGGRGAVGGMIGGSGAGGFGGAGSLGNVTQISGRGSMTGSVSSAAHLVQPENLGKKAISHADAAANGAAGLVENANAAAHTARAEGSGASANTDGEANGSLAGGGNAAVGLDVSGGGDAAGSIAQDARATVQPVRQGLHAQAQTTRAFVQESGANAKNAVGQTNASGNARQIAGAARPANVQPQRKASGAAQGNGSASISGSASGSVSGGGSAIKGE